MLRKFLSASCVFVAVALCAEATSRPAKLRSTSTRSTSSSPALERIHRAALQNKVSIKTEAAPQTPSAPATTNSPLVVKRLATMQTPQGYIATASLNGLTNGSYVAVHGDGAVTALDANGEVIWNHGSLDFTTWTGRYPPNNSSGDVVPANALVHLGIDPLDPFFEAGEHPFDVGDLNGDGIDDVAVAHYFSAVTAIAGSAGGTLVSALDGQTGNLLWSHFFPGYVNNVAISGGMLVVANESGALRGSLGQNGTMSILQGWTMANSNPAWTISTGQQWAPWLALEKLPDGKIAAAWTNSALSSGNTTNGNLLLVDVVSGATDWTVATAGYPRFIRFDATRNRVVAMEEADPTAAQTYSVVARAIADGSTAVTITEANATALNLQVGDIDGDGSADYIVSDIGYLGGTLQNSGRVLALNGTTGAEMWNQTRGLQPNDPADPLSGSDVPRPYGLAVVPGAVVVGSFIPGGNVELERLNGSGAVLWSQSAPNLFLPLFMSIFHDGGGDFIRVAASRPHFYGLSLQIDELGTTEIVDGLTPFQVVRAFSLTNGNKVSDVPLLGRINSAAGTKVNGDATMDFVVGGESGAVFALDGTKIDNSPVVLWRKTVAGPIHQIAAADLDGDGHDEIIVAATHALEVLDAATGNLRYEIPSSEYIWQFALADLNNDGKIDIVVPAASAITAYSGSNGSVLWTFAPSGAQAVGTLFSNVAITADKIVTAQFAYGTHNPALRTGAGYTRAAVGINGATGTVLWTASQASSSPADASKSSFPQFWRGTVAGELDGTVGSVAGFSWVQYDASKDVDLQCDNCFTPEMEIRDALTGGIVTSLPPPPYYNGSEGTLLVREKGILSYAGNASWLLAPNEFGEALGTDIPLHMLEGNFGALGRHVIEQTFALYMLVFPQNGIQLAPWNAAVPHSAIYNHAINPGQIILQDLDGDGDDEIIRVADDFDGHETLVSAIQGFGVTSNPWSDGMDIVDLVPAPLQMKALTRLTNGSIRVQGVGAQNTNYTVEASPDLSPGSWTSIATVKSSNAGVIQYDDTSASTFTQRFYRFTLP